VQFSVDQRFAPLINGWVGGFREMSNCLHCGRTYAKTRATRKYCSSRCKTNACLERHPRRIRAADVEALHALLDEEVSSVAALRERLRSIVAPQRPAIAVAEEQPFFIPRLD
jgi:hypothetical protein